MERPGGLPVVSPVAAGLALRVLPGADTRAGRDRGGVLPGRSQKGSGPDSRIDHGEERKDRDHQNDDAPLAAQDGRLGAANGHVRLTARSGPGFLGGRQPVAAVRPAPDAGPWPHEPASPGTAQPRGFGTALTRCGLSQSAPGGEGRKRRSRELCLGCPVHGAYLVLDVFTPGE